jgi:hypothetical protein
MFRPIVAVLVSLSLVASAADLKYSKKFKDNSGEHQEITLYSQGQRLRIDHRNEVGYGWKNGRPETIAYGPRVATIYQCDMHRALQLDFDHHQYTAIEVDRNGVPLNASTVDPPKPRQSGGKVKVILETRDTGETKQIFGQTARHFITTRREIPAPGSCTPPHESTEDGWYIDVEPPQESCMPKPRQRVGIALLVASRDESACIDDYEVERLGPTAPPFVLEVTRTTRETSNPAAQPVTTSEIVTALSRLPLDPQIFDLPTGYKHVERLDESPSLPWLLRGKLMWQSVKNTVWGWTPWGK